MRLSFKVEIQPTPKQLTMLLQAAGNARWAYNWGLAKKEAAWEAKKAAIAAGVDPKEAPKVPSCMDLHKELVLLKSLPEAQGGVPWMYLASKAAPQEALRRLDRAYENFFRRVKSGQAPGYPKFKSKSRGIGGFGTSGEIHARTKSIQLPRIGRIRIKPGQHGYLPTGKYSTASVTEKNGRWYVSITSPEFGEAEPNNKPSIGIDLGVAQLATLSDGTVFENPKALTRGTIKIKKLQKELCRRKKGSNNRNKTRIKLARAHARVVNVRKDSLNKATTLIAKNHGHAVIEDLQVKNMTRRAKKSGVAAKSGLNRVVLDASFGEFRRILEYKGKIYGCKVTAVPAAYTSQKCSVCRYVDAGNRLTQAAFCCLKCGFRANADLNAARNILVAGGPPETKNACGVDVGRVGARKGDKTQSTVKQELVAELFL